MPSTQQKFAAQLALYGPRSATQPRPTLPKAQAYCRKLARDHYENFTVASWLLPATLRQHFYSIYAYCRWADDLADETSGGQESLVLLDWWEEQLDQCLAGAATHPVFVALSETMATFSIPAKPFRDLLVAFRQDQWKTRYATREELLEYCRHSANPVGRLILYLGRCHDVERAAQADALCTGLQLANFCQDVARDWARGRIYLPRASWEAAGYDESAFTRRENSAAFRRLLAGEVNWSQELLLCGLTLADHVPHDLRVDVELFARGGLAILAAIRQIDYDVWKRRPVVSKLAQFGLLVGCWGRKMLGRPAAGSSVWQPQESANRISANQEEAV